MTFVNFSCWCCNPLQVQYVLVFSPTGRVWAERCCALRQVCSSENHVTVRRLWSIARPYRTAWPTNYAGRWSLTAAREQSVRLSVERTTTRQCCGTPCGDCARSRLKVTSRPPTAREILHSRAFGLHVPCVQMSRGLCSEIACLTWIVCNCANLFRRVSTMQGKVKGQSHGETLGL